MLCCPTPYLAGLAAGRGAALAGRPSLYTHQPRQAALLRRPRVPRPGLGRGHGVGDLLGPRPRAGHGVAVHRHQAGCSEFLNFDIDTFDELLSWLWSTILCFHTLRIH